MNIPDYIDVRCPYCGELIYVNELKGGQAERVVRCERVTLTVDGRDFFVGCRKLFAVTLGYVVRAKVFKMDEVEGSERETE